MSKTFTVAHDQYRLEVTAKKPFPTKLWRELLEGYQADLHEGEWNGTFVQFDPYAGNVTSAEQKTEAGISRYAVLPWGEEVYQNLEKKLKQRLKDEKEKRDGGSEAR